MTNYNGQLPPVLKGEVNFPQTTNSTEKVEKNVYDSRNYLDFSIPPGQQSREITIRLLPIDKVETDSPEYFKIVHLHNITVNKELKPNKSGKKTYMCLDKKNSNINHEVYGSKCPVCEEQQRLWNLWHEETDANKKKIILDSIKQLNTREYCIVRCIERGNEKDGPKFWRIPLRQDKTDAYHTIHLLTSTRRQEGLEAGIDINILCCHKGRDLKVTFTEGNGSPTVVDKSISVPLTNDPELFNKWYYDEKKWSDVFSTKPYDYLKVAFEGEVPWYDKINNRWISKKEFDGIKEAQENSFNSSLEAVESQFIAPTVNNTVLHSQFITPTVNDTALHSQYVQESYNPQNYVDNDLPF